MQRLLQTHAKRLVAFVLIVGVYFAARIPTLSQTEREAIGRRFQFARFDLPEVHRAEVRGVRPVHPSLQGIAAWISSVGGSVALWDIDGDGLANDVCYVDTRSDEVVIAPVPGTPARYEPFALAMPAPLFDRQRMCPTGCIPGDLNEDGLTDILVYFWGRTPVAFLRRDVETAAGAVPLASDKFSPCEIAGGGERWFTNAATRADVDGDGHVDLLIGNYFEDGARILDANDSGPGQHMQHSMSRAFNGGRNRLLLWAGGATGSQPAVRFREVDGALDADGEPVSTGWTLAVGAADLDADLLPEIFFGNDFGPDRLLHNRSLPGQPKFALLTGRRGFTTPASKVLGHDSFKGMGVDFGDVNGDGRLDIYVSNIAAEYALEESHFMHLSAGPPEWMQSGVAPFVEASEELGLSRSGWGWDSRLADFDNDGVLEAVQATGFVHGESNRWPELHEVAMGNDELLSSPMVWHQFQPGDDVSGHDCNPFFVRASDGRFYDVCDVVGTGGPQVSRGIATADVDGDGDLDFAVGNQWENSRFYRNDAPRPGKFLGLRLFVLRDAVRPETTTVIAGGLERVRRQCRPAIGASVVVEIPGSPQRLVGQVDGGNGHSGTRSPELHFGLGHAPADEPVRVEVRWRSTDGRACRQSLELLPGWHTVILGST